MTKDSDSVADTSQRSRLVSSTDHYPTIAELLNAPEDEVNTYLQKPTTLKKDIVCLLREALSQLKATPLLREIKADLDDTRSHLKTVKSLKTNLDSMKEKVDNSAVENEIFKESMIKKLDELTTLKVQVDNMCAASVPVSNVPVSQPRMQQDTTFRRQLKVIGVNESVEAKNFNERALTDKTSIEKISAGLGTEVIIEDCRRLGKFTPGKNRPILVTFSSVWDVRKLRSKAIEQKLYQRDGILIVPELSYDDRQVEKKLLKKRYDLMSNGTEKSRIKIKDLILYVDGQIVDLD